MPNTTNISFDRVEAESLLIALDLEGVAVSTGSACSSGTLEPSHVLRAMGFQAPRTQSSLRFSLGLFSTDEEVDRVIDVLPRLVEKLRGLTRKPASVGSRSLRSKPSHHEGTKGTKITKSTDHEDQMVSVRFEFFVSS